MKDVTTKSAFYEKGKGRYHYGRSFVFAKHIDEEINMFNRLEPPLPVFGAVVIPAWVWKLKKNAFFSTHEFSLSLSNWSTLIITSRQNVIYLRQAKNRNSRRKSSRYLVSFTYRAIINSVTKPREIHDENDLLRNSK